MTDVRLDHLDLEILRRLSGDSRSSIRKLSRELGVPPSTLYSRIKRLEELGVVRGYTAVIDYAKLGFQVTAAIHVSVEGKMIEELERIVASRPEAVAVYDITGEYDMLVIARFRSIGELDRFIKWLNKLEGVKRTVTSIAFRVVKEDNSGLLWVA